MRPAGHSGSEPPGEELGTNGLTFDATGAIIAADHGNRAIARIDTDFFTKTILAGEYEGKRLNSPNDLVFNAKGDIYFTDPSYGLEGLNDSPVKELDFNGVYLLTRDGRLTLLTSDLSFPNGIALSPDEGTLYVALSDGNRPVIMSFDVQPDGTVGEGRVFFDGSTLGRPGAFDGLTLDVQGNLFATGPGGVLVITPEGKHLGTLETGQATSNVTFGGPDLSTLYITADMYLLRIPTNTRGIRSSDLRASTGTNPTTSSTQQ
jgi:gluconolactonase